MGSSVPSYKPNTAASELHSPGTAARLMKGVPLDSPVPQCYWEKKWSAGCCVSWLQSSRERAQSLGGSSIFKIRKNWVICIRFLERNHLTSFCMKKGSAFLKILLSQLLDECWGGLRLLCHEACSGFGDSRWPSPLKGSNFAGSCNAWSIRRFSVRFFVFELSWLLPQFWTKQRIRGLICKLLR